MKYLFNALTKLIAFSMVILLILSLCACGNGDKSQLDDSLSGEVESSADESEQFVLTVETAEKLLEQDRLVTEIFVCNYLWDAASVKAERCLVFQDNAFADFSAVENLINSTYVQGSGDKEFFLSYPQNQEPSVVSQEGKTSVFCHTGSYYNDYADYSTLSVSKTDDEKVSEICFSTLSGNNISVKAFCQENGNWLLEKGIYRLNPPVYSSEDLHWGKTNAGSLKNLSGKTLVIKLFVSDKESQITPADETFFHQRIDSALQRITADVSRFGITPEFEYLSTYFEFKESLGTRPIDFDMRFAQNSFGTLEAFAEQNADLSKYDNYFLVVCTKKDMEASVGVFDKDEDKDLYFGERVLVGSSVTDFDIYKSVLCLLGANPRDEDTVDKYTESLYEFYFPNDFVVTKDLATAELSPVTAYLCGFTDELNYLYKAFIPKNNKK